MYPVKKELVRVSLRYKAKYPNTKFFRDRNIAGHYHQGIDLAPRDRDYGEIYINAPVAGVVIRVDRHKQYGWQVRIKSSEDDNNKIHILAHMKQRPYVKWGQKVKKGDILGIMGSTGCSSARHTHYEVRIANTLTRVSPVPYLT